MRNTLKGQENCMAEGNREKDGYMTLEASFIMPVTVILITAIMYLAFYLYTVAFLNQAAYIAAFRASLCDEGNVEAEAAAARELDKLLNESVLPISGLERQINVSAVSVNVSLQANLALPAPGLQLVSEKEWDITAEKKALIRDAAAFIRAARRIGDFIE